MDFKAPRELWNPLSKAVRNKYHGRGGHSKYNKHISQMRVPLASRREPAGGPEQTAKCSIYFLT